MKDLNYLMGQILYQIFNIILSILSKIRKSNWKSSIKNMLKVRKCWHHLLYADVICFFVIMKCQKIIKNWWKLTKIANLDSECPHIFRTTWGISIKFSGNMWFAIISKVTKKQSFALALEDTFLEIQQGWVKLTPPHPPIFLWLNLFHL